MNKVTVQIDSKWQKIIRSPIYYVIAALSGPSISFAPWFLYLSGKGQFYHGYEWFIVPLCFATIILVPLFYFRLGTAVVKELRKSNGEISSLPI